MKLKCTYCKLIHDEGQRNNIIDEAQADYDICPSCGGLEATEATLRDSIIDIIGFGMELERAELMAMQIEILFKEEAIKQLKIQSKLSNEIVDKCFNAMGIKS